MSDFDLGHRTGVIAATAGALVIGALVFSFVGATVLAVICGIALFVLIFRA